ncbi:MAG: S-layer family protein [Scytonema sp. PMC 1069.18]|nr:S-layer family protein [Scytonema sp. PMC 1069.18]MEC4882302.1 S-layer family protein [Scytonema sp. PMC 1070.18]
MGISWSNCYWRFRVACFIAVCAVYAASGDFATAQITPDATLGPENSMLTPNVSRDGLPADQIDGGAKRGTSLFHSFQQFNVRDGQRVFFANPVGVENIFSRVTGTDPSVILGTLGVNGGANLFLLNPNGIIFGPNARLDLRGSFLASTARGIKFSDSLEFSTTNPSALPLLTLNVPIGLQYGQNAGRILVQGSVNELRIDQATGEVLEFNRTGGLEVEPGQTLALAGGEVVLEGGNLSAESGRVEVWSVQGEGLVGLTSTNPGWELSNLGVQNFQDIRLSQTAAIDTSGIGGGKIQIQGRRVTLQDGSLILSLTKGERSGGTISIKASESIEASGSAPNGEASLFLTETLGIGKAGDVEINTGKLILQNGAQVSSGTFNQGSGGKITVKASELVEATGITKTGNFASGLFSVARESTGEGGTVEVTTRRLVLQDGAQVSATTFSQGRGGNVLVNASESVEAINIAPIGSSGLFVASKSTGDGGRVEINTGKLILQNGAQVSATAFSQGNGGDISVNAEESVEAIGTAQNENISSSLGAQTQGSGNGGKVNIKTGKLILLDGAQISATAFAFSQGNGGDVVVDASESVEVIGIAQNGRFASSLGAQTQGSGNGGKVEINTKKLILRGGAQVSAATANQGRGGDILINASESVEVIGIAQNGRFASSLRAQTRGTGNSGTVTVNTGRFIASKGAQTLAAVFENSKGNGGNINIRASEVELTGTSDNGDPTIVFASTRGDGDGGKITIETARLVVQGGAQIGAGTFSKGEGGNVFVKASDSVELIGTVPQVPNRPFFRDQSGQQFPSGLFTGSQGMGSAGNLQIEAENLTLRDGAEIGVNHQGQGDAGNLEVVARNLLLNNQAVLSATTTSGQGGDMRLQIADLLLLRRNSQISTSAGIAQAGGDGGNIVIDSSLIVAIQNENSDITAQAFQGRGGNIDITTQGLFGFEFRNSQPQLSEITASSEFGIDGAVEIDIVDVNPAQGLVELPAEIVDVSGLIEQNFCRVVGQNSEFVVTGRGGFPSSPNQPLRANAPWEDLRLVQKNEPARTPVAPASVSEPNTDRFRVIRDPRNLVSIPAEPNRIGKKKRNNQSGRIIEAQGWIRASNGNVLLTAEPVTVTPQGLWLHPLDCQRWKQTSS